MIIFHNKIVLHASLFYNTSKKNEIAQLNMPSAALLSSIDSIQLPTLKLQRLAYLEWRLCLSAKIWFDKPIVYQLQFSSCPLETDIEACRNI